MGRDIDHGSLRGHGPARRAGSGSPRGQRALGGNRNCTRGSMAFGSVTCDDSDSEPSQRSGGWGDPRPRVGGLRMSCGLWFGLVVFGFLSDLPTPGTPQPTSLRGEVVDADTGRPIPCRVSIRGEDGAWHFPESASPEGSAVAYRKDGDRQPRRSSRCTRRSRPTRSPSGCPPGRYTVTAERGKEYHPERREVTVGDEPVRLTIRLRRWIDMAERGWYSGDTHTHRTLAELPNVMLAEDLNVAFPLTRLGPRGVRPADRAPRGVVPRPRPRPDPGRRHPLDRPAEHRVRDLHRRQGRRTPSARSSCSTTRRRSTWACRRSARSPRGPIARGR